MPEVPGDREGHKALIGRAGFPGGQHTELLAGEKPPDNRWTVSLSSRRHAIIFTEWRRFVNRGKFDKIKFFIQGRKRRILKEILRMFGLITKEELKARIDRGEDFKLVDVRDTPDYKREHIPGAVHLLIAEMNPQKTDSMFDKSDLIVTYSLDENCPAKRIAAQKFVDYGFTKVLAYEGSWKDWKTAGYPTER